MSNIVYIAASLDGFIADKDGGLNWLQSVPNPENSDLGFADFLDSIDCIVMGRNTFETVAAMDIQWPYPKHVFVLSNALKSVPEKLKGRVEIIKGSPDEITAMLDELGYERKYIDGGKTIQIFLECDRIDEMIISRLPILLGGGTPLFGVLPEHLMFEHTATDVLLNEIVVSRYRRKRLSATEKK
ncbi:MAG: dihydrofolate reductase [Spirochaetales bacterium]|nr:dihydrofolate reductase [Spirochaetales bacterium]